MIQVDEKKTIRRLYFIKRHGIRQVAAELCHSRKTVKKAIVDVLVPQYHQRAARTSTVMGPYIETIKLWLREPSAKPKSCMD